MKRWFLIFGLAIALAVGSLIVLPPGNPDDQRDATESQNEEVVSFKQEGLRAPKEEVPYGCLTYGIDESSLEEVSGIINARFAQLGQWEENELCEFGPPPPEVAALHEKRVYVVGFMFPLESGREISKFKLMRSTQTCCWGPAPDYNQFALVTTPGKKVKFERIKPVAVVGKFFVECKPRSGYIYRIEGKKVEPAIKDDRIGSVDYAALEKKGITRLDFSLIEKLGPQLEGDDGEITEWPKELLELEGKRVFAEGYVIVRLPPPFGSKKEKLIVSKYPNAQDATLTNSVYVRFSEDQQVPAMWANHTGVTGILTIHRRWESWRRSGIIMVDKACEGVPE